MINLKLCIKSGDWSITSHVVFTKGMIAKLNESTYSVWRFSSGRHHGASNIHTQSHHGHITDLYMLAMINLRNITLRIFHAQLRFNGRIITVKFKLQTVDCYKILLMPWQPCFCGMCKICSDPIARNWNTSEYFINEHGNFEWNNIIEMVPRWHCSLWASLWLT